MRYETIPQPKPSARASAIRASSAARSHSRALLGVSLFIVSETMFFLGLFFAWYYMRATVNLPWPPPDAQPPPFALAAINTAVALLSTVAVAYADRASARDNRAGLLRGVTIGGALGTLFLAVQAVEFTELARLAQSGPYGSTFTFLLVFHALRVFAGVVLMAVVLVRTLLGHFSARRRLLVQATAMYWYFITAVWLAVFTVLYLL